MMAIFTVTMLLVIATEIIYQTSVEQIVAAQGVYGVQAYYAAKAGAEISLLRIHLYRKAVSQFGDALPNKAVLDPIWNIPFTWPPTAPGATSAADKDLIQKAVKESTMKSRYLATIEPETGKIDINDLGSKSEPLRNSARRLLMQALEARVQTDREFGDEFRGFDFNRLFDAIAYYSSDSVEDRGGLQSAYGPRATRFLPPRRPFKTVQELRLVPGVTDKIFDVLAPRITVYGAKGINVNYAPKEVLMSLSPQIDEPRAKRIIEARMDPKRGPFKDVNDFVAFLNQIGVPGNPFTPDRDPSGRETPPPVFFDSEMNFRIRSTGISGKVQREVTAIVYDFDRVKARWDQFNPPTPAAGAPGVGIGPTNPGVGIGPTNPAVGVGNTTPTPTAPKVRNERPNVVYWNES